MFRQIKTPFGQQFDGFGHFKNWFGHFRGNFGQKHKIFGQLSQNFGHYRKIFGHLTFSPKPLSLPHRKSTKNKPATHFKSTKSQQIIKLIRWLPGHPYLPNPYAIICSFNSSSP
ncbi:hypothetical protein FZC76_19655 [Sutcliffiella horikoshii]|uniref:Uncharacterized protein n=1 Tax=Sutcliffiella horikoshii TaxID=79883 RepID=A0A5D4SMT9_9BACI|nr:hypothetical protein FZC76_19655 [Sutcliffiella horikoshii]